MKRILTSILFALAALSMQAQTDLDSILRLLEHKRVEFSFSCRILQGEVPLDMNGSVKAQGDCFVMKANGVESRCDGKRVVMMDSAKKEAYIESSAGLREYLIDNFKTISNLKLSSVKTFNEVSEDLSEFGFDESGLDSSWVVTDLRD